MRGLPRSLFPFLGLSLAFLGSSTLEMSRMPSFW